MGMLPSAITVGTYSILPGRIAIENEDGAAFAPEKGISTLNVSVFPNPNPGIFRIQTKSVTEPASLLLINALGQVVWKAEANSTSSELEVNIQNLPNVKLSPLLRNPDLFPKCCICKN